MWGPHIHNPNSKCQKMRGPTYSKKNMTAHTQQPLPIPLHNSLFRSSELRSTHPQSQSIPILRLLDLVHASKYHPTTMGFPKKNRGKKKHT